MAIQYVQMSFVPLMAIVFSLILFIDNKTISKTITKFYIAMDVVFGILVAADISDFYFASLETLNDFRYLTSLLGYSLRPLAILLLVFTLIRNENSVKKSWLIIIPAIINALMCVLNVFTKWVFSFNLDNTFVRGPLGYLPHIVSAIYLMMLLTMVFSRARKIDKAELVLVLVLALGTVAAVVLESLIEVRCLVNGVGVISGDCYFIYLNTQTYRRDELTNLLNRRSFYTDIKRISGKVHIVCIDMNNLKDINDTQGHIHGDKALTTIARILTENVDKHSKVYRVGGDEFVVLSKLDKEGIEKSFAKINDLINKEGLSIAHGYALYNSGEDFEQIYTTADKLMYKNKEEMKVLQIIENASTKKDISSRD